MSTLDEPFSKVASGAVCLDKYLGLDKSVASELLLDPDTGLRRFLNYLYSAVSPNGNILLDIKYEQAYRLGIDNEAHGPVVLTQLVRMGVPIIHLIRRDAIAQAVSHLVALRTGVFSKTAGDVDRTVDDERIWLDPEHVLGVARSRRDAHRRAREHLSALHARHMTVFYEDISGADRTNQIQRIFQFVDQYVEIPDNFVSDTIRQESRRRVVNMDDINHYIVEREPDLVYSFVG